MSVVCSLPTLTFDTVRYILISCIYIYITHDMCLLHSMEINADCTLNTSIYHTSIPGIYEHMGVSKNNATPKSSLFLPSILVHVVLNHQTNQRPEVMVVPMLLWFYIVTGAVGIRFLQRGDIYGSRNVPNRTPQAMTRVIFTYLPRTQMTLVLIGSSALFWRADLQK